MEEASNACNGKHRIYYFIEYRRVNKLCGEFEANPLSDILKYSLVVDWCNIEDFGLAMLEVSLRHI